TSANDENVVQPLNVMASRQAETNVGQHLMETLSDTQMEVALPELNINRSGGANSAVESTQLDVPAPEAVAVNRPDRSLPPLASPVQPSSDAALPMDIQMPDIQMSERATPEAGESEAQMADAAALDFPAPVAWEGADSAAHADSSVLPRLSANIPSLDASHLGSAMDAMRRQELAVEFSIPEPTLSLQEMMGLSLDLDDLNVPDQSTMDSLSLTEEAFRALPVAPERNAAFAQRAEEVREDRVEEGGGSEETERAVADALKWLAAHQSEDGSWDADLFDEECGQCGGESAAAVDRGITGLSLLCFLASNHTHVDAGPYQDTVARGLRFLRSGQSRNGDLRGEETMYSHAIATIALAEALAMSEDSSLRDPVERAISFIDRARNARDGGWRYDPGQAGDTSVLGWQVMALKSAGTAGLEVPWESLYAAKNWLDAVGTGRHGGLYQYMPGRGPSTSMTAEGLFVRKLLGETSNMPRRRESVERILDEVPTWSDEPNTYYWYYATLALFQEGGDSWKSWNAPMVQTLLTAQRRDGKAAGSWDPADRWSRVGGRVYQTAICTLTLQVYYRYLPGYAKPIPEDAIGRIEGVVRDSATGEPISDAMVRLDLADRENIRVSTDADGRFELYPPPLPDFFALSASAEGFLPDTVNVPRAMVMGKTLSRDFNLTRMENPIIALEADPRVHHLGDDDFSGRINSQFQRDAEGSRIEMNFELSESDIRASGLRRGDDDVTLTMMVKGVQLVHRLFVNDQLLDERLEDSPANGSFGEFTTTFPRSWLRLGENSFEIRASRRGNDVDDFEFVNVKIRLAEQP
ncbi:MAG: carboxypeptidase regulatory-like domain-containing protein, partial [Phycisphaerae bacterium]